MRTSVLVCLLAALAVSASSNYNSPAKPFKGQNSYVYRFDTQVATSLVGASPSEIQQSAVTRLRADARLSFTNDRHAKVQLTNVRIGELNGELPKSQRVQPLETFERKQLPQEVKNTLEMPLSVSYVDGVVERINFHEEDQAWSKNIKRAVLNMIQLNLKRNDVQGLKMQSSIPEQDKEVPVFSIPEITIEGECEAVYTIQKNQKYGSEDDEMTPFNVTKTINFNKCERTADLSYGYRTNPAEQLRCINCIRQQKPQPDAQSMEQIRFSHCQQECQPNKINEDEDVERSTFTRFELMGKPEKYAIKRTSMLSQYIVKAQNPAAQNTLIQVVAISELTFKEQQEGSDMVGSFKQASTDETMLFSAEWDLQEKRFYMYGDEEFPNERQSPFDQVQKKENKAAHAIKSILRQWSDKHQGYELDAALNFNRLVDVIRKSSVKEIKSIEQAIKAMSREEQEAGEDREPQSPEHRQQQAVSIFQDALAVAATHNSLSDMAEKITNQEISTAKAVILLKSFTTNQHSASDRQADILERIAKHEVSQQSPALKQTAWLSFGQAVGEICQDKPAQGQKQTFRVEELCPRGKKEQYKKTLMEQWQKAETIYEQILALKTIGNAALDNTVDELQQIVKNKRQPTLVRMEVIDAMRRLRTSQPQKIRQSLLPIFQNQREQPEIRMAAFSMIMYTHPEKSVLDQLTFTTINDRSQNVKSFVLTTMEALSKSPSSAEQEIANHMKAALKMVKLEPEQLRSSRKYRVPIYVSEQENTEEQNIFIGLASIVSPSNMLPIHLSSSLRSAFNGEATEENIQLSMSQKNLEQWYEKLAELAQSYAESDEQQRDSMERRSAKDLRAIYSSLGIKSRRTGSYYLSGEESSEEEEGKSQKSKTGDNKPFGMICIRTNDVDTTIVPISEHNLPEIVRRMLKGEKPSILTEFDELTQKLASGKHFRQHIGLTIGEKRSKIPTSAGLPLDLIRKSSAIGSVEGELKVRFDSENLEASRGLTAELKMRTSGIATHIHKAEVWTPVMSSGVQTLRTVELNGPLDVKLRADSKKVELKIRLPQEKKVRFMAIHTLPITYTRQFDLQGRNHREPRVRSVQNRALEHTQRERHISEQKNNVIQVDGHYHQVTEPKQILKALYTTENNVHFYYNPQNERTPKELTLRISGSTFQKHSEHARPELDSFYSSSKGFKPIYSEDYEGMELEGDEDRRERLSSYSKKYSPSQAYKHQLRVEAEAKCGHKTHKVSAEIKGACDAQLKHCKVFVDAERTPLNGESQEWTMKTKIQTVAPEQLSEDEEPSKKQSRMLVQIDSEWGADKRSQVNVRLQAEPTKKTYWKSDSSDKWARFLNKYDMVAEYKLHSQQKQAIQRAYELVKAKLFWQLSTEDRRAEDTDVVRATMIIDPVSRKYANISVQTPNERVRLESVELPVRVSPYSLQGRHSNFRSIGHLIRKVSNYGGAECRADENRIRTFDGVAYKAPMSDCWHVLAKDCSRDEPRFVVLMKKTQEGETKVKIVTPKDTVELSSKNQQDTPAVKVNGKHIENEDELHEEDIEASYGKVYVSKQGINVEFDGEEAKVKIGGMYKNLQCGLCGHYNDEEEDVFRTGNNERSTSLKQFHKSYTLKNEECSESKLNKFYEQQDSDEFAVHRNSKGRRQNQWFDSEEQQNSNSKESIEEWSWKDSSEKRSGKKSPIERTKVIEYQRRLCFSNEPVKRCPKGTSPDEKSQIKEVKVQFFCLDRNSVEARRLLRQVRKGENVDAEGQNLSFVEAVDQPTKCVPVY